MNSEMYRKCNVDELIIDLHSVPWHVMDSLGNQWDYWKMFNDLDSSQVLTKKARVQKKTSPKTLSVEEASLLVRVE